MAGARVDGNESLATFIGGLPEISDNSLLWSGKTSPPDPYIIQLQRHEVAEVESALHSFKQLELDGDEVSKNNFPLPTLQNRLRQLAIDIHHGQGFCLLRGIEPSRYSVEDLLIVYLGISSYIGDKRGVQNRKGDMLTHIIDSHHWTVPYELRHGIHTNGDLPFHSDMGASILALQFRQCATQGGETSIASASMIYNGLLRDHPRDLAALVSPDWPIQVSGKPPRYVSAPLIQYYHGHVLSSFDPGRLGLHPASRAEPVDNNSRVVPGLTPSQLQALETVSKLAEEHCVRVTAQPGDILFINNWALVHARSSYTDGNAQATRHLVRLWLHNSELGWDIPPSMSIPWQAAFGSLNGNDACTADKYLKSTLRNYPVVPVKEYKAPKYTAGSAAFVLEDSDEDET